MAIEDLIRKGEITFFNGKVLDTNIDSYGKYNWNLIEHLRKQYYVTKPAPLRIGGSGLHTLLGTQKGTAEVAGFIVQLDYGVEHGRYHVDFNINKFQPLELGEKLSRWAPHLNNFEKQWHWRLCWEFANALGFPGGEMPANENMFNNFVSGQLGTVMIGNKEQLPRYLTYPIEAYGVEKTMQEREKKIKENVELFLKL